ncbi:MAG TPA: beta-ketoacyl-ACP synthase II [Candidatus Binatia bacterium]|jgi:3-oxoacyl-[acyl-carrier-protein] synthase II
MYMHCNAFTGRRVVITGLGAVSAIGIGRDAYWDSLKEGRSGIKKISSFDTTSYPCDIAGEITDFDPADFMTSQQSRRIDRFAQLAIAAARLGIEDAGLEITPANQSSVGMILGTSLGTLCYLEQQLALLNEKGLKRINPFFPTSVIPSSAATQVMLELKIKGTCKTVTTACASSTWSIGEAFETIKFGKADVMLAGGSEAPITPSVLASLGSLQLLAQPTGSPASCYRPFCKDAAGFVLGEGAGILVLEELEHALRRGAPIYAEIGGFGSTTDAYHVMAFEPSFERPVAAIHAALVQAEVRPGDLGYINPHGIAIPDSDHGEATILKLALGEAAFQIPVSATKPMTGHTLGACGALELIGCCLMMENEFLHPTINYTEPDPICDLDFIPNHGRPAKVDAMMSVSFGFGGYNAACVLRSFDGV